MNNSGSSSNSLQETYFHGNRTSENESSSQLQQSIITHFENINILANIVQNSQRLLESSSMGGGTRITNATQHIILVDISNMIAPHLNMPASTISYEIVTVDCSNQSVFDQSNANIFDVLQYSYIPSPLNDTCPITRDAFTPEQNVYMIASCKHIFNKFALRTWLQNNNTCPSCRCIIQENSLLQEV